MLSREWMRPCLNRALYLAIVWLGAGFSSGQEPAGDQSAIPTFGVTVVAPYGFCGRLYALRASRVNQSGYDCSTRLPDFQRLSPIGQIYTTRLAVPLRDFKDGFPGVTGRFEWFAIEYATRFWIETPGKYSFSLASDDGSALYIDEHRVINNDCMHSVREETGSIDLQGGLHDMRVGYFQGPRWYVALELSVKPPSRMWRIFDTGDFRPPSNPADWKYGNPEELNLPVDPCKIERRPQQTTLKQRTGK